MKALVFHGPGQTAWQDVPDPGIKDAADAIVRVEAVTICGTDLHIIKGDVPEVTPGRVLGHEAVGTVVETGGDVRTVRPGDRVLISCISSCGRCRFCREGHYGQCRGGGWVLGHTIDGTQAEYVRVPFADLSVPSLPSAVDSHDAVLLADIFPTSYEVGVLNGNVQPGGPGNALVTHRFELGQMEAAYDVFARAGETSALKVVLGGPRHVVVEAPQPEAERL